ncbi:hypothetical protein J4732_11590 [Serratia marcescens]|uniref:Type II secretion system protein GspC N-terminal domain-containing protein n=1 Tax=Serratia marcescens TaxID=615 RepID=A0A939NJZ2_SERMA|nr:hypothetical protein [Serratia marcescens]
MAGLLFSDNAKKLVIVEHGGKQTGYGVGDRLAGSNAIVRIVKNKILLDENGYYATLTFKESRRAVSARCFIA